MPKKSPNKFFAPIVIAGITIGFLASAYQFLIAPKKRENKNQLQAQDQQEKTEE